MGEYRTRWIQMACHRSTRSSLAHDESLDEASVRWVSTMRRYRPIVITMCGNVWPAVVSRYISSLSALPIDAARKALSTAKRSIPSCSTAPHTGVKNPRPAKNIPTILQAIPPTAL